MTYDSSGSWWCNFCSIKDAPDRYRCVKCADFDFCGTCYGTHTEFVALEVEYQQWLEQHEERQKQVEKAFDAERELRRSLAELRQLQVDLIKQEKSIYSDIDSLREQRKSVE